MSLTSLINLCVFAHPVAVKLVIYICISLTQQERSWRRLYGGAKSFSNQQQMQLVLKSFIKELQEGTLLLIRA